MEEEEEGIVENSLPEYHNNRYIYPVGFCTSRLFPSSVQAGLHVTYTSEIIRGEEGPLFAVTPSDWPEGMVVKSSSSAAWGAIIAHVKRIQTAPKSEKSVSGPSMFGLSDPTIARLIEELPNADKCVNYVSRSQKDEIVFKSRSLRGREVTGHEPVDDVKKHEDDEFWKCPLLDTTLDVWDDPSIAEQRLELLKAENEMLPMGAVDRIMKRVCQSVDGFSKVGKDAKEYMQMCATEFLRFVAGEATERDRPPHMITGKGVLRAMYDLGMENYRLPLERLHELYCNRVSSVGMAARSTNVQPVQQPTKGNQWEFVGDRHK